MSAVTYDSQQTSSSKACLRKYRIRKRHGVWRVYPPMSIMWIHVAMSYEEAMLFMDSVVLIQRRQFSSRWAG